jgi:hypothetical protein
MIFGCEARLELRLTIEESGAGSACNLHRSSRSSAEPSEYEKSEVLDPRPSPRVGL